METKVNRRSFVRVGSLTGVSVLVAACTPAAAPAPDPAAAGSSAPAAPAPAGPAQPRLGNPGE